MDQISCKLTVYFEDPFWVGVFEHVEKEKLSASKVTFGAEPKDYEVEEGILKRYEKLRFSPSIAEQEKKKAKVNPKRLQRNAKKETLSRGIGTKSMQALKLLQEETKRTKEVYSKEQKEAFARRKFELKQAKKKEKHKGR